MDSLPSVDGSAVVTNLAFLLGVLQGKAREVFLMAVKQGHFRNEHMSADGSRAELNLHALTAGVAMLSLHNWLQDIQ